MVAKLLIKGGRVIDPANKRNGIMDVLIDNGKVKKVEPNISESGAKSIDAKGLVVCPGFIDMHVHLREPGREDKETIETCSRAAARGGFTTIAGMPNTTPSADNQTVIEFVISKAKKEAVVNVLPIGTITKHREGKELAEMRDLKITGAVAVSDDGDTVKNPAVMMRAMQYSTMWDMPIISHSEETELSEGGVMHEGLVSTKLGLPGKPVSAEDVITARELVLAEQTGAKLHFAHVSTKGSVEMIRQAKKKGLNISAETCPHYYTLTDEAVIGYNPNAKMNPPLRSEEHRRAVVEGIKDGTIDVLASDHAPHLLNDKFIEFAYCENGIVGLETEVGLAMTHLVGKKVIKLEQMIEKFTVNPAKALNLEKGTLSEGADGDVTILDTELENVIDANQFESKARNTPYKGWKLKGAPVYTIVAGKVVMKDRKVVAK